MKIGRKRIEKFLKSRDYRDICYFITHVKNVDFRKSLIEELGYRVGIEVTKDENTKSKVFLGKRKEIRMYISDKFKKVNIAYCVILDNEY